MESCQEKRVNNCGEDRVARVQSFSGMFRLFELYSRQSVIHSRRLKKSGFFVTEINKKRYDIKD